MTYLMDKVRFPRNKKSKASSLRRLRKISASFTTYLPFEFIHDVAPLARSMLLATGPRGNGPARVGFFINRLKMSGPSTRPVQKPQYFNNVFAHAIGH